MRLRTAAAAGAAAALALVIAGPAAAVQTDQFGLRVGDSNASALVVPAGSGTVTHSVLVTNRTRSGLTVELAAVGVQRGADGVFSYGSPGTGAANAVRLGQQSVRLGPLDSARVPVTIAAPSHVGTPEYAAVVGVADGPRSDQLTIRPRLAVLVELTARTSAAGAATGRHSRMGLALLLTGAACLLVAGGVAIVRRRRPAAALVMPEPMPAVAADVLPAAPARALVTTVPAAAPVGPSSTEPARALAHPPVADPTPRPETAPGDTGPVDTAPAERAAQPSSVDRLRGRRPVG